MSAVISSRLMNGAVLPVLALYIVAADEQGRLRRSPELAAVRDDIRAGRVQAKAAADTIIAGLGA